MSKTSVATISFKSASASTPAPQVQQVQTVVESKPPAATQQSAAERRARSRQQLQQQPQQQQQTQVLSGSYQEVSTVELTSNQEQPKPQKTVVQRASSANRNQVHLGKRRGLKSDANNEFGTPPTPFFRFKHTMSLRAPKAGDAFFTEQRQQKNYDEEEKRGTPRRVADWISRVLHGQVPALNGHDWKTINEFLKDGTVLCSLMNKLLRHAGMDPIGYRKKVNSAFVAINNLEVFSQACKRYGVPDASLLQPSDVIEARKSQMLPVINCLNALGCVANARGFQPPYEEPLAPKADWCKDECYE